MKAVKFPMMRLEELELSEFFRGLFPRADSLVEKISADMSSAGYDSAQPLTAWHVPERKVFVLVDGYTRYEAAKRAGLEEVPVNLTQFDSQRAALDYAIHVQRDRRNLTDGELLHCIRALRKLKPRGGDKRSNKATKPKPGYPGFDKKGKSSAQELADKLGTSRDAVEKLAALEKRGSKKLVKAVEEGRLTRNRAYKEMQREQKKVSGPQETPKLGTLIKLLQQCGKEISSIDWAEISREEIEKFLEASQPVSRRRSVLRAKY